MPSTARSIVSELVASGIERLLLTLAARHRSGFPSWEGQEEESRGGGHSDGSLPVRGGWRMYERGAGGIARDGFVRAAGDAPRTRTAPQARKSVVEGKRVLDSVK